LEGRFFPKKKTKALPKVVQAKIKRIPKTVFPMGTHDVSFVLNRPYSLYTFKERGANL
jgi:hypothetical protein